MPKRGKRPAKREREKLRRERIAASMREYRRTGKTRAERARAATREMPPLPKGFGRIDPRAEIASMLEQAGEEVKGAWGFDYDVRHALNSDLSLSYELRLALPSKLEVARFMTDLTNALKSVPGTWVSIGFRFRPKRVSEEERESYDRYRGALQIQAYTRRSSARRLVALEATAEEILENVKEKKGWKPEQVFVRVHWSKEGVTGKRPHRTTLKG